MAKYVHPHMIIDSSLDILKPAAFHSDVFIDSQTSYSLASGMPYALVVEDDDGLYQIQSVLLGTMAFEPSSNYYTSAEVDGLKAEIDASIERIDASLNDVIDIFDVIDASLALFVQKAGDTMTGDLVFDGSAGIQFGSGNPTITTLDTSTAGLTDNEDHVPSSALLSSLLDAIEVYQGIQDVSIAAAAASVPGVTNGLSVLGDGSIGLGGTLIDDTVIVASSSNTLAIQGLQTSVAPEPLAVVIDNDGEELKTRKLGTMAWATATDYVTQTVFDASILAIQNDIDALDASMIETYEWNVAQDASIDELRGTALSALKTASNGLTEDPSTNVKLGGTLTEDTTITGAGHTFTFDVSQLTVNGDLYVDGTTTTVNSVDLNVSDNIIVLNYGETGSGVSLVHSGIVIDRGNASDYFFGFSETTDNFRVGMIDTENGLPYDTQAVATREDTPVTDGIAHWNATANRFDTTAEFVYDASGLGIATVLEDVGATDALFIDGNGKVVYRELGSLAFEDAEDFVSQDAFDASFGQVWDRLDDVDTSLGDVWDEIIDLSTNKLDGVASTTNVSGTTYEIYAGTVDNIAYLRQIVAGPGATIQSDASTITIGVTGASSMVSKYVGTFNGTSGTSHTVFQSTHNIAGNGPFTTAVYENGAEVYLDVVINGSGDVTFNWTSGSLTDVSCMYIITG